ncbi:hypothetical protein [Micromonospora deserti]|uniref:Uncharacterized protein n=1 Tax=Micromonospora deserti TaxID=2070366 RepID=A0A2W2DWS7_9ACTN|nr:hypothetical protein [Micromonospora deserti]PZG01637.1 hypothetical protein C1I99_06120 [Micromonospora deserti]
MLGEKITVLNDDPDRLEREAPDQVLIWCWVAADGPPAGPDPTEQAERAFGLSFRLPSGWLLPWQR